MASADIDRIDRKIIAELQRDARITNADLANRVGLSESPCLRRVRRLEAAGFIKGYHAQIDEVKLGVAFNIFVGIKVRRHADDQTSAFETWAGQCAEIAACSLVSGEIDYLLHVAVENISAYEEFLTRELLKNTSIKDIRSNIALRVVKSSFGVKAVFD